MAIGNKIRNIRVMRGMTQRELGLAVGLPPKSADVRIAQYEIGARVPKEALVQKIAATLKVNAKYLMATTPKDIDDLIYFLFYMDEAGLVDMKSFEEESYDGSIEELIRISFPHTEDILKEWYAKKNAYSNNKITREEYSEWKLNWPDSAKTK